MDQIVNALEPCKEFAKDSMRLVKRCTKPDRKGLLYVKTLIIIQPVEQPDPKELIVLGYSLTKTAKPL